MPMRRIRTSLPTVGFEQDSSPLTEGMLHAASTLGELWPKLKQIEAEKQQRTDANSEHRRARDEDLTIRKQERTDDLAGRKQERTDSLTERQGERSHAQSLWNASHGVDGPDAISDYGKRVTSDDARRRDEHLADTGSYEGDDRGLITRQFDGVKSRLLHSQLLQKQVERPFFAPPHAGVDKQSGISTTQDGKKFFIKNGEAIFIDQNTGKQTPSSVLVSEADAKAADAEKTKADDAIVSSKRGLWELGGWMPGSKSRESILAQDNAEKANAARLWDAQHPAPNNLLPGVTPDDPHGIPIDDQDGEIDLLGNPITNEYNENAQLNKLNKTTRASYDAIMAEGDPKRVAAAKQMLKGL